MAKLWLYAVFHINLAFSSIPQSHYPIILDRCYWPLLEIAQRMGIPFGFEATGYSLEMLNRQDASFVQALKKAWAAGQIEFIGSGYTQSIFPLCPSEVNRRNLSEGHAVYEALLGKDNLPTTAYVNEQTYSSGLVDLYLEAGYTQLFMEWNNPARFNAYPSSLRYGPQRIANPDGSQSMAVVWNDAISFQKLQRLLANQITPDDYLDYLQRHSDPNQDRSFPFYGSDAEIIDYHPGQLEAEYLSSQGSPDLQRLVAMLEKLSTMPHIGWTTPAKLAEQVTAQTPMIRLESPEYPLPCKKQPKYNPTRWAVTGLEDTQLNTRCVQNYQQLATLESLTGQPADRALWRQLLETWGSDFRTQTTDEKRTLLRQTAGSLEASLAKQLSNYSVDKPQNTAHVQLWNPNSTAWQGPLTLEIQFPERTLHGYPILEDAKAVSQVQIESIGYYRDGSIRWIKAVLMVNLPPLTTTTLLWESGDKPICAVRKLECERTTQRLHLQTAAMTLDLQLSRGGAIDALRFNALDTQPWIGTISHGTFEDIALGADFYSGHFILAAKSGEKATDLSPCTLQMPEHLDDYPIRIPIQLGVQTAIGNLWKTLYLYRDLPRLDLHYHFRFRDVAAASCRVGMMTILPNTFDLNTLVYRTVNGGLYPETFGLKSHRVNHSEAVSATVSANHGLGATAGWVALEDQHKRIILRTYPQAAYAMPMIHFEENDPSYFLRILPSIGEFDETSHLLWRGHHQVMFTWQGQHSSEAIDASLPPVSLSAHAKILPV